MRHGAACGAIVLAAALAVGTAAQQTTAVRRSPQQPAILEGQVVDAMSGIPLRRAHVAITPGGRRTISVLTDDDGVFRLSVTRRGSQEVSIAKAGYVQTTARIVPDSPVHIQLTRGAVISGRVIDSSGKPRPNVHVVVSRVGGTGSEVRFAAFSDDLGEYRVSGLRAGEYDVTLVTAEIGIVFRQGESDSAPTTGGATSPVVAVLRRAEASRQTGASARATPAQHVVSVGPGDERRGVDFAVHGDPPAGTLVNGATGGPVVVSMPHTTSAAATGVVSGRVVDEHGEPLQAVSVHALQLRQRAGRVMAARVGRNGRTDDRGLYRIFQLPPGRYLVVASLDPGVSISASSGAGYAPLYHPGVTHIDGATPLEIDSGTEVAGVDLVFAPAPVRRIRGIARTAAGEPMVGLVRLMSSGSRIVRLDGESVAVDPDGSFELSTVPPGEWIIQAQASRGPGRRAEFGAAHITVGDRDPPELMITTSAGATLAGRIVVEGEGPGAIAGLNIVTIPADFGYRIGSPMSSALIDSAGEFFVSGLIGRTIVSLRGGRTAWYLRSISIDGIDATDVPFDFGTQEVTFDGAEIVLSRASASVAGRVVDERGDPVADYSVIVFPVANELWTEGSRYLKLAGLRGARSFRVGGLPPGEFWIAAIEHVGPGITPAEWQDAAFLEKLMTVASRFDVAEDETATVTLRFAKSVGR